MTEIQGHPEQPLTIQGPEKPGKRKRNIKSESERIRREEAGRQMSELGTVLPKAPLTAEELMAAWSISPREIDSISVIIFRHKIGTNDKELVAHIPVPEYNFRSVARDFGPGTYYLKGSAGKFQACNAKFLVSQEYAHSAGYGKLPEPPPPPPAQDLVAAKTLQTVSETAGIMPVELFSALERIVENGLDRRLGSNQGVHHQLQPFDPMKAMTDQMNAVEMQWNFMEKMEQRARRSLAGKLESDDQDGDLSWGSIIKELIKAAPSFISALRPQAAPSQHYPPTPDPVDVTPKPPQSSQPEQESRVIPEETVKIIESLSMEDRQLLSPAVEMLQPFTKMLLRAGANVSYRPQSIADDLTGWVPPECYQAVIRLGELARDRGPGILGVIGPEFISERWSEIIQGIAKNVSDPEGE